MSVSLLSRHINSGIYWTFSFIHYAYKKEKESNAMFILIGAVLVWAMKLMYRLIELMLRLFLIPVEICLWALRFLLF